MTATKPAPSRAPSGFTIVEMLVVIGILVVLVGLLLPALSGAQSRARKAKELSRLRQIGIAWNLYAQSNQDAALPGYLEGVETGPEAETVQEAWRVRYNFPNGQQVADADAATWPWRIMQYLDHSQDLVLGHLDLDGSGPLEMSDYSLMDPVRHRDEGALPRPTHIAQEPAFGYNALYVGGWWDEWAELTDSDDQVIGYAAVPRFRSVSPIEQDQPVRGVARSVVTRAVGNIRKGTSLVLFCSSSLREPGASYHDVEDARFGWHAVVPPYVATESIWLRDPDAGADEIIKVVGSFDDRPDAPVPVGRYTGQTAVLYADLHVDAAAPGSLDDQQRWIDVADDKLWRHSEAYVE